MFCQTFEYYHLPCMVMVECLRLRIRHIMTHLRHNAYIAYLVPMPINYYYYYYTMCECVSKDCLYELLINKYKYSYIIISGGYKGHIIYIYYAYYGHYDNYI